MSDGTFVKGRTANPNLALVIDILKYRVTLVEVARQDDLTVAEVERWVEEAVRNMENGFRTRVKGHLGVQKPGEHYSLGRVSISHECH